MNYKPENRVRMRRKLINDRLEQLGVINGAQRMPGLLFHPRSGVFVTGLLVCIFMLSCILVSESAFGKGEVEANRPELSTTVDHHQAPAETQSNKNPLDSTLIRVGVCVAVILFAGAWFLLFHLSRIHVFMGAIVAVYVCFAFVVGKDHYPVSRFDMYAMLSSQNQHHPSRLVARDKGGELHMVTDYSRWQCDGPIEPLLDGCHEILDSFYYIPYIDSEDIAHVTRSERPTKEIMEVELVRAVWRVSATSSGVQHVEICPLVRCRVAVAP